MGRSAGTAIQLVAKEGDYATLRLPSGEMRMVRDGVPRLDRRDRQRRAPEHRPRQGRPLAPQGQAPADARHRHEPGRPPARRRRGLHHARAGTRSRPGACRRSATARARRTRSPTATSCAGAGAARRAADDVTILQEGPVGRGAPDGAHRGHERVRQQADGQDLVAHLHDLPRDGRPHDRRPRRPQARAGVRLRVDGRPQAGRVRAHARVPRPRRRRRGEDARVQT